MHSAGSSHRLQAEAELLEAQREEGYILQLLSIAIDEQHEPGVRQVRSAALSK